MKRKLVNIKDNDLTRGRVVFFIPRVIEERCGEGDELLSKDLTYSCSYALDRHIA